MTDSKITCKTAVWRFLSIIMMIIRGKEENALVVEGFLLRIR